MKTNINYYYKYYLEIKHRLFLITLSWLFTAGSCYNYKDSLLFFLTNSITDDLTSLNQQFYFIFTDISEIFYAYINIIFFVSNQVSFVLLLYHFVTFLSLGLYKKELIQSKVIFKYFILTWFVFIYFFYNVLIPFSWNFFLTFQQNGTANQPISILFETKLFDFLDYFINFYSLCFLSYQFVTIVIFFLNNYIKTSQQIKQFRKIFYLIFLLFSTIITPPEIFSQILITSCLILMYELLTFIRQIKINLVTN